MILCPKCGTKNSEKAQFCQECGEELDQTMSKFDVFISYSIKDKKIADAVCVHLESKKISCWIAPRDIIPGNDWGASIIESIKNSSIMVLIFSSESNHSPQVIREVERAVNRGLPIIPFRIEDINLSESMEYFISSTHWLDALTPPIEIHIEKLTVIVTNLIKTMKESKSFDLSPNNSNFYTNKDNFSTGNQEYKNKSNVLDYIIRGLGLLFGIYAYTSLQNLNNVYGNLIIILLLFIGSFLILITIFPRYFYFKIFSKISSGIGYNPLIFLLILTIIILMLILASVLPPDLTTRIV